MTKRMRRTFPRLALAAVFAGGIGVALCSNADADDDHDHLRCDAPAGNVISACFQKGNGNLRLACGQPCRPGEKPISWSLTGPPGPAGDDGAMGDPGVSGLERIDFSSVNDSAPNKSAFARCPEGKHVGGGGAQNFIGERGVVVGPIALKKSLPSDGMDGWAATAEEVTPTEVKWFVTAYALCALTH